MVIQIAFKLIQHHNPNTGRPSLRPTSVAVGGRVLNFISPVFGAYAILDDKHHNRG